ncbi:hypothetical protein GDO86_004949 [Hymenochirus boettgeri]|uniref:Uncharacterized protein n=1 Tax=Hymenochirus boettgeri TaxID=247094 RepID=A0A8T2J043_9PIPI|nr:hypothetical protein GDO86_004949 [Hymenochirus boettgeri]
MRLAVPLNFISTLNPSISFGNLPIGQNTGKWILHYRNSHFIIPVIYMNVWVLPYTRTPASTLPVFILCAHSDWKVFSLIKVFMLMCL